MRVSIVTILNVDGLLTVILPLFLGGAISIAHLAGYVVTIKGVDQRTLYLISATLFVARLFLLAPYQVATRRPLMFEERYNAALPDAFRYVVRRKALSEDQIESEHYEDAYRDLRQAAVNGDITIWGRPDDGYAPTVSRGIALPPLAKIAPDFWLGTGFEYLSLLTTEAETDNWHKPPRPDSPERYRDLQVDMRQVKRLWPKRWCCKRKSAGR